MARDQNNLLGQVEIRILAEPSYLSVARVAMRAAAEQAGVGQQEIDGVILALDEALANVIRHSYGGACKKPIIITLNRRAGPDDQTVLLELVVRDYGRQVDPATIKSRDLNEIRPGGLGVHIIKSVMDEVEYSCPLDGGMRLRMLKRVVASESKAEVDERVH